MVHKMCNVCRNFPPTAGAVYQTEALRSLLLIFLANKSKIFASTSPSQILYQSQYSPSAQRSISEQGINWLILIWSKWSLNQSRGSFLLVRSKVDMGWHQQLPLGIELSETHLEACNITFGERPKTARQVLDDVELKDATDGWWEEDYM